MPGRKDHYGTTPKARRLVRQLGQNVRALRQHYGWSMVELGQRSGLSWRMIEKIEQEGSAPSFVGVVWLAEAFDVTINQLVYMPLICVDGRLQSPIDGRFIVHNAAGTRRDREAGTTESTS